MRPFPCFRLIATFSLLLLVVVISFVLPSSTRLTTHAAGMFVSPFTKLDMKTNCGTWNVKPSPNAPSQDMLNGVAGTSSQNMWAVGSSYNGFISQTLIEHWDGTQWSIVPSPNVAGVGNTLYGVAVLSASDAWAVGYEKENLPQTLIEHWNGTQWSIIPSPSPAYYANYLFNVTAISTNDVWAVGHYFGSAYETLIEHWDGTSWNVVASPNPGPQNFLSGVTAISTKDVWAVGHYADYSGSGSYQSQTLFEHWDGTSWNVVASPNPNLMFDEFLGVTRIPGTNNLWVVGHQGNGINGDKGPIQTLTAQWDGSSWSVISSPNPGIMRDDLLGVTAFSLHNAWTVGFYIDSNNILQTLIEHWDGTSWTVVPSPSPGSAQNSLNGIAHIARTSQIWTVGYSSGPTPQTLIEFHC